MRLSHSQRVLLYAALAGLPAVIVAMLLLWLQPHSEHMRITVSLVILGAWIGFSAAASALVIRPLQTAANLLSALREGDFSIRAHEACRSDALGELYHEINQLSELFNAQRLSALEATALVETVMQAIDVAVFAFDETGLLRLANPAAQRLLDSPAEQLLGCPAAEIGLAECLEGEPVRVLAGTHFPGGSGRWGMRRTQFREQGRPHALVVIADLSQALRAEETKAWQRLVRVLGHELNNSLAPIKSIAGSLGDLLRRNPRPPDTDDDVRGGLEVIASRAESLSRFMQAYSKLARLPAPTRKPTRIGPLLRRVASLEQRLSVSVIPGPDIEVSCDSTQVEQALINLVRNAVEASLEQRTAGHPEAAVRVGWSVSGRYLEVRVEDDGPGLANTANLFVPFFTTKPEGSGIGLVLSRQVAENHDGALSLSNRPDGTRGCLAQFCLPL